MSAMQIRIDDRELRAMLGRAPEVVAVRLRQLVEGSAIDVQREMRIAAPVAVTGQLRNSITYVLHPRDLRAEIGPNVNYGAPVEYGTKPHRVSVAPGTPLRKWAQLKGINPYALQNSIARKGTKPHPFVAPTYRKMKPRVESDIAKGIAKLVEDLSRGGI
jgi:phage gpG-like protein